MDLNKDSSGFLKTGQRAVASNCCSNQSADPGREPHRQRAPKRDFQDGLQYRSAFASAATFAVGGAMPLLTVLVAPQAALIPVVIATSILFIALLGGFGRST
jgi:VIT1/CCC1 family predicted Fe2+/Mn2+ transporter